MLKQKFTIKQALMHPMSNAAQKLDLATAAMRLTSTRIRARAVGFVYSWSRLSTVFSSLIIAALLGAFGSAGVFAFIAGAMGVVVIAIGVFGPRTAGRSLEAVSH